MSPDSAKTAPDLKSCDMETEETVDCIYDDHGNEVHDGDKVRVNGCHVGTVRLLTDRTFEVHGWPEDVIIESLTIENT